jgi:hypothetical protein
MIALKRRALIDSAIIATALLSGCIDSTYNVDGYACKDFVQANIYSNRSQEDRLKEIQTYSIDKQYAAFICGVQYVRPPQWDTAEPFAEKGDSAAEFLVGKLPKIQDDLTIGNIVTLVNHMDAKEALQLRSGDDLVQALELAVSRMKDGVQRQHAKEQLRRLIRD